MELGRRHLCEGKIGKEQFIEEAKREVWADCSKAQKETARSKYVL